MYFQIWLSDNNKQWYWHLRAANHQVIANGEGYYNREDCERAIALVQSSYNAPVYDA